MRHVRQIAPGSHQRGLYSLPETTLGAPASKFEIAITRSGLEALKGLIAHLDIEGSEDGASWVHLGGLNVAGGKAVNKDGSPLTESVFSFEFSEAKPADYRLRGNVALYQAMTAGMRLTVY